jgi:hypothetical protein
MGILFSLAVGLMEGSIVVKRGGAERAAGAQESNVIRLPNTRRIVQTPNGLEERVDRGDVLIKEVK